MKLQINNSGSWKTIIDFHLEALEEVMDAITLLGHCGRECGSKFTARVLGAGDLVSDYWTPDAGWYTARALVPPR